MATAITTPPGAPRRAALAEGEHAILAIGEVVHRARTAARRRRTRPPREARRVAQNGPRDAGLRRLLEVQGHRVEELHLACRAPPSHAA